ncbi:MAG: hypothetical protein AAF517_16785, partial [Planctomycetota bacterium]
MTLRTLTMRLGLVLTCLAAAPLSADLRSLVAEYQKTKKEWQAAKSSRGRGGLGGGQRGGGGPGGGGRRGGGRGFGRRQSVPRLEP